MNEAEATTIQLFSTGSTNPIVNWTADNEIVCIDASCSRISYRADQDELIFVSVSNEAGCTVLDSVFIKVVPEEEDTMITQPIQEDLFYVPNIVNLESSISNNICVSLTGSVASVDRFALYNRWGNLVADDNTSSDAECLLGDSLISNLPVGVYVYYIEVTLVDGRVERRAGDVTLIR